MNSRTLLNIGLLILLVGLGLITFFEPGLEPAPVAATLSTISSPLLSSWPSYGPNMTSFETPA